MIASFPPLSDSPLLIAMIAMLVFSRLGYFAHRRGTAARTRMAEVLYGVIEGVGIGATVRVFVEAVLSLPVELFHVLVVLIIAWALLCLVRGLHYLTRIEISATHPARFTEVDESMLGFVVAAVVIVVMLSLQAAGVLP